MFKLNFFKLKLLNKKKVQHSKNVHQRTDAHLKTVTLSDEKYIYTWGTPINDFFYWKEEKKTFFLLKKEISFSNEQNGLLNAALQQLMEEDHSQKVLETPNVAVCSVQLRLYAEYDMTWHVFCILTMKRFKGHQCEITYMYSFL